MLYLPFPTHQEQRTMNQALSIIYPDLLALRKAIFAKAKTELQALRKIEPIYLLTTEALRRANLPCDHNIELRSKTIYITCNATSADSYYTFQNLARTVSNALDYTNYRVSLDTDTDFTMFDSSPTLHKAFWIHLGDNHFHVEIKVRLPELGIADLKLSTYTVTESYDATKYCYHFAPTYDAKSFEMHNIEE